MVRGFSKKYMIAKYKISVIDTPELSRSNVVFTEVLRDIDCEIEFINKLLSQCQDDPQYSPDCIIAYNNDLSAISDYVDTAPTDVESRDPGVIILLANQPTQNYITNAIRLGIADVIDVDRTSETGFRRSILNVCQKRRLWKNIICRQNSLEYAHKELKEKNDELMRFYHNVSHELKTPLTSCVEHISIVREGIAGPLNPQQSHFLDVAISSCNQMANCINDLLDTNGLDSGTLSVKLEEREIYTLLKEIHRSFTPVCNKVDIDLKVAIEPDLPNVVMDTERIRQVVSNLIGNAMKHTDPDGCITLHAGQSAKNTNSVTVSVEDTGKGIPSDQLEKIFSPLYQIDPDSEDLATAGLGLGLSICKHILELHGSQIRVSSEVGAGSTFLFNLSSQTTTQLH